MGKRNVSRAHGADLSLRLPPGPDQIRELFGPLTFGKTSAADRLSVCGLLDVYRAWSLQKAKRTGVTRRDETGVTRRLAAAVKAGSDETGFTALGPQGEWACLVRGVSR
jgi:hypothetical protein